MTFRSYLVYDTESESSSGGDKLAESLVNGLVIVGFVAALTFLMVLLYKYNCFKVFKTYDTRNCIYDLRTNSIVLFVYV